ncbi:MAG: patatin family protein [Akkermansia sp.]|nr:patatin family protein [Akkermansia sp.]
MKKTGLVLEGGAMRGMFTAGILDVFMEKGIRVDGTIGVSAGAAFGVNYKSGQIGRAIRYNTRFCNDPRYCGWRCLLRDGNIFSRDFAYEEVPLKHDPFDFTAYCANSMPFYLVCTNVETGQPVYHQYMGWEDHGFEWIRASASMPLVSEFVEIDGCKLLDGGIADSIPLRYFESLGYNRNVVILTQPPMYEKKENALLFLVRLKYRKYPHLVRAMQQRHVVYNETLRYIEAKEQAGEIFVLRPESPLPVSRVEKNPANLRRAYEIGRQLAHSKLELVQGFLESLAAL